ncbi:MAG TPA: dienelactone hydrolase family protein [Hyphomonadaceae bacterium]|nr:dienelactone hydrolase family protein [Hyphomonadaceae bacterium]
MSFLDVLLLAACVFVVGWWMFASSRQKPLLRFAPALLVVLALLQFALEGFYWQLIPAYVLILALTLMSFLQRGEGRGFGKIVGAAGLGILALGAIGPFLLMYPAPYLVKPDGHYLVGTHIYRWIDTSRPEQATDDTSDKRNVVVQAWYPAAANASGPHSIYMDGLKALPDNVEGLPSFLLRSFGGIDTHGITDAPISDDLRKWPVIVFQNGYGASRAFYTGLITQLASRGYVVLAVDNPYEAVVTQLADGSVVYTVEHFLENDPDRTRFMKGRLDLRVEDIKFVLDQIARPDAVGPRLAGHLDLDHVAAIGHSAGGAAAALAMDNDDRIKAAVNIDGTLYGGVSDRKIERPFLLIDSDHSESGHSTGNEAGNRLLAAHFGGERQAWEIKHANHFSFTDAMLYFPPPARFAVGQLMGGARGPEETQHATVQMIDAFLRGPLTGHPEDLKAVVATYKDIVSRPE